MRQRPIHTPEQEGRAREILARLADLRREERALSDELFFLTWYPRESDYRAD